MTEPQDVLAEALRATYDDGYGLGYRLVLMDESGGVVPTPLPDTFIEAIRAALVRTPETLDVHNLRLMLADMHESAHGASPKGTWVLICEDDCPVRVVLAASVDVAYAATPSPTPPEGLRCPDCRESASGVCTMHNGSSAASPAPDPGAGLREALEEAITLPLGGGFQVAQAHWRKAATEYDRRVAAPAPDPGAGLREAWKTARKALRAVPGGSPYLTVVEDLMGWAEAQGQNSNGHWSEPGDTPAEALRNLAAILAPSAEPPETA